MLKEAEKRYVSKIYLEAKCTNSFFIAIVPLFLSWFVCFILDMVIFNKDGFYWLGTMICACLVLLALGYGAFLFIKRYTKKQSEKWRTILTKCEKHITSKEYLKAPKEDVRADDSTINLLGSLGTQSDTIEKQAKLVAKINDFALPSATKYKIMILLVPCLLVWFAYVPEFLYSKSTLSEEQLAAASVIDELQAVFEKEFETVTSLDPLDGERNYYYVKGYLNEGTYVYAYVDDEGTLIEIVYYIDIDTSLDLEDALSQAEQDLTTMNAVLWKTSLADSDFDYLAFDYFSEDFIESTFVNGRYESTASSILTDEFEVDLCYKTSGEGDEDPYVFYDVYRLTEE